VAEFCSRGRCQPRTKTRVGIPPLRPQQRPDSYSTLPRLLIRLGRSLSISDGGDIARPRFANAVPSRPEDSVDTRCFVHSPPVSRGRHLHPRRPHNSSVIPEGREHNRQHGSERKPRKQKGDRSRNIVFRTRMLVSQHILGQSSHERLSNPSNPSMPLQEGCQLAAPLPGAVGETFAGEGEHRDKEFLPL
jgi:hypothetical protein